MNGMHYTSPLDSLHSPDLIYPTRPLNLASLHASAVYSLAIGSSIHSDVRRGSPDYTSLRCWRRPRPGQSGVGSPPPTDMRAITMSVLLMHASAVCFSPASACQSSATQATRDTGANAGTGCWQQGLRAAKMSTATSSHRHQTRGGLGGVTSLLESKTRICISSGCSSAGGTSRTASSTEPSPSRRSRPRRVALCAY